MITKKSIFSVALLGTLLSGCSTPQNSLYDLSAAPLPNLQYCNKKGLQLLIAQPNALRLLDSENILIKGADGYLASLKDIEWSDRLPQLVQARILQLLSDSHCLGGVARPGEGVDAHYVLWLDIENFEVQILSGKTRLAYVNLNARLLDNQNGRIISSRNFSAKEVFQARKSVSYVKALNNAFSSASEGLVLWTLKKLPRR